MGRIITWSETDAWLRERKLATIGSSIDLLGFREVICFAIPKSVGTRTLIATDMARVFSDEPEVLLFITDWEMPSPEYFDWNLFRRFRQALGDSAELDDKPSHVLGLEDQVDLVSLIRLVLYSFWDCYLVSADGRMVLRISHDDLAWLYVKDDKEFDEKRLELFKPFVR